jgi:hypothetical protein
MPDAKQIATDWDIQELSRELRDGRPDSFELRQAADYLDQLREMLANPVAEIVPFKHSDPEGKAGFGLKTLPAVLKLPIGTKLYPHKD